MFIPPMIPGGGGYVSVAAARVFFTLAAFMTPSLWLMTGFMAYEMWRDPRAPWPFAVALSLASIGTFVGWILLCVATWKVWREKN